MNLEVPIALPSAERIEELLREAALQVVRERDAWLSFPQAAEHWGVSPRTFERKRAKLGLPVSVVDGVKKIFRADLDAALRANLKVPKVCVIQFPSVALREAERKADSAA